jgi:hypothetical protein
MNSTIIRSLAHLVKARNDIERKIAAIIGRPGLIGHVSEYIASEIFGIKLEESASSKGIDGHFVGGSLAGKGVNIKWYTKQEYSLDLAVESPPDYYLVVTGPKSPDVSSLGMTRPWLISSVYLFDSASLIESLGARAVSIGIATSVVGRLWREAEIYPLQTNKLLSLTVDQRSNLALFG